MSKASRGFRLLILPSLVALWPLLLFRPSQPSSSPARWHRRVIIVLAIVLPLSFAIAIASRKPAPVNRVIPGVLLR